MHFTDQELVVVTNQGIEDIFSGTESYAQRYMQGMLFANDAVSFNDVNGMEGLLSDISNKISQFAKWLWQKMKAVFDWLFGGKSYTIVIKEGRDVIDEYNKDHRLKSDAGSKIYPKLMEIAKRFKEGTDEYLKNLKALTSDREKSKLTSIGGASIAEFEKHFEQWNTYFNTKAEAARDATNVKEWGYAVLDFIDHIRVSREWFAKNYVSHNAVRVKGETTQEKIDAAIKKDIEKIEDPNDQKAASMLVFKLGNIAVACGNYFSVNAASCNVIISSIKTKTYFDKK